MTEKRDCWKEARLLREKALGEEETARRMEEQKNKAFTAPPLPTGACTHARTDERPGEQD